jgi:lipoprotein NlpI
MQSGDCRGAVCETNLSISLSRLQLTDHAVQEAQEAVNKINDEPSLSAWEANEVGVILFRAPKRNAKQLTAAAKAFRFARAHYSGRASNIAFNLAQTLLESGELSEAHTIQHELETRTLIDPNFAILGEFQGVSVERH